MAPLTPGTHLHDRYVLHGRVGAGGMGEVWHAHDLRLDRPVAIKLIPDASERQIRSEAQAAARLAHPHITAIYDFGDTGQASSRYGYLVMELLTGQTLADRLATGPMPWPETVEIARQIASALAAAHDQHIVHRDIKPANIMLTAAGVKVLDFGIAGVTHHEHPDTLIAGTPAYTAPERIHGDAGGPAADVYGLAVVVYEALTGRLPRPIITWQDLAQTDFTTPVAMPTGVPHAIAPLLAAALAAEPQRRPTAAQLVTALTGSAAPPTLPTVGTALTEPTIVTTRPAGIAAVPVPRPAPTTVADMSAIEPGRSPARVATIAVTAVAVLIIAIVILSSLHKPSSGQDTAATAPTTTATTPSAPPSPQPSASPATGNVDALLATLQQAVDTAIGDGSLGHDQAKEVTRRVQRIQAAWQNGDLGEFRDQCQQLQDTLNNGGDHGNGDNGGHGNGDNGGAASPAALTISPIVDQLLAAADGTDQ